MNVRAISLHQPYASGVALGLKRNETRHWPTKYRGPLAIHAAQRRTRDLRAAFARIALGCDDKALQTIDGACDVIFDRLPFGAYVCTCNLIDCVRVEDLPAVSKCERLFGDYSPGRFAWILDGVQQLPEPVLARGRQGFWSWKR